MNKYYSLHVENREATIFVFGDITSWEWFESDVSSYTLSKEIAGLDVDVINVRINSYGGEVAEGWAIYNSLKVHKAKIRTYCDGFACSAASVIFMAGDERIMSDVSLLFIHNAWTYASGDAAALRKEADALEKISDVSANAYRIDLNITDEELQEMLDAETWITPIEALEMGFATMITNVPVATKASQCARKKAFDLLTNGIIGAEIIKSSVEKHIAPLAEPQAQLPAEPTKQKTFFNF